MSPDFLSGNLLAGGCYEPGDIENESQRTRAAGRDAPLPEWGNTTQGGRVGDEAVASPSHSDQKALRGPGGLRADPPFARQALESSP